jgi:hypothetical protein
MRMPLFLLACVTVFAKAALGEEECRCWTPDAQQIAAVEATIASRPLPLGSLDRYVRYYVGTISHDRRFIRGKLVPARGDDVPGAHVVEGRMPPLQADGCVTNSEPGRGTWVILHCASPGAWTPSDREIAELEGLLPPPVSTLFRPGSNPSLVEKALNLHDYARHYAGVMEGDRRVIVGVFVVQRLLDLLDEHETAGIYIGSEAELPHIADGACAVITVRYDPSSKQIWSRCNGVT